jgi:hypothetical protein
MDECIQWSKEWGGPGAGGQGGGGKTVFQGNCFQECFDKSKYIAQKGNKQTNKQTVTNSIRNEMREIVSFIVTKILVSW